MIKLDSMLERLAATERQQVEAYAAELLRKRAAEPSANSRPNRIQFDKLEGMLDRTLGPSPERDEERQARDAWADAAED